jgi:hypothetical protein
VYVVPAASAAPGVSVATFVVESYDTLAATGEAAPCAVSVKLDAVIVVASIDCENVAVTVALVATPVAPSAGDVDVTLGEPSACATPRTDAARAASATRMTSARLMR